MFVRNPNFFENGDVVENISEIAVPQGRFTPGHSFVITSTRGSIPTAMRCQSTGIVIQETSGIDHLIKFVSNKNDADGRPVSSQFQDR